MTKMKLSLLATTALLLCSVAHDSNAGVVLSHGINGKGKPTVGSVSGPAPAASETFQTRGVPTDSSTLAAGLTLKNLFNDVPNAPLAAGPVNKYSFTVASCIDSFVTSILFGENENIVGLGFAKDITAGIGLFVLGIEGRQFTFAGYSPFSNGFTFEIYTASATAPPVEATATPEPSTLLVWGGLLALCGASRSVRRLF